MELTLTIKQDIFFSKELRKLANLRRYFYLVKNDGGEGAPEARPNSQSSILGAHTVKRSNSPKFSFGVHTCDT